MVEARPGTAPARAREAVGERPERLTLAPFPALRYDSDRVGDLGAVTAPPYDVLDDESVARLRRQHPYNIVRLIAPRLGGDVPAHYQAVAAQLRDWRADGVLRRDQQPALYVYEQASAGATLRGLVGCLGLHDPAAGVVLPHEDVMPGPVADRYALMSATEANLEPILLSYAGGGAASQVVEETCSTEPLFSATSVDGARHRVWALTRAAALAAVAGDLADRQALIADGHHRYATYLRLCRSRSAGPGTPWASGLAMLVDQRSHPLTLDPIHRSVAGLTLAEVAAGAAAVVELGRDAHRARERLGRGSASEFAVTDGDSWHLVDAGADARSGAGHSDRWHRLDVVRLHHQLFPRWGVTEERVGYHHDAETAVRTARQRNGVAVLLRPPSVADVMALAAAGERMPRKSTSFGPKPRMGLLLRSVVG